MVHNKGFWMIDWFIEYEILATTLCTYFLTCFATVFNSSLSTPRANNMELKPKMKMFVNTNCWQHKLLSTQTAVNKHYSPVLGFWFKSGPFGERAVSETLICLRRRMSITRKLVRSISPECSPNTIIVVNINQLININLDTRKYQLNSHGLDQPSSV